MADTGHELAQRDDAAPTLYNGVDPADEPSAAWGWHGGFPKGSVIAGWVSVVILLLFLIGNHQGKIEDIWLVGIALVMAGGLVRHHLAERTSWRR